jgi:hypothetical protein
LFQTLLTSFDEAVGILFAIELIHRMRFSRDTTRIKCVFDNGSPVQSWLKQTMSRPRRTAILLSRFVPVSTNIRRQ